jgi:CHAT domain-containing protein
VVFADGGLTLAELRDGAVNLFTARLVTLSACETGLTDVIKGSPEEYVGLPAGFLLCGVPCVVSSLWTVPDLSTALLMGRFYDNHLKQNMNIAAALQNAQVWVRDRSAAEVARYANQCEQAAKTQEAWARQLALMRYYQH